MKTKILENRKIPSLNLEKFKIILIGNSKYPEDMSIKDVPNIQVNISLLKKAFINNNILGVPIDNITVLLNKTKIEIEKEMTNFVKNTNIDDTVIFYYAGHGFISSENFNLYLSTKNSNLEHIESTSISIKRFNEIVINSFAKRKIIILDACHSGGVHNQLTNNKSFISKEINKIEGCYVLSSSSEDEPSLYPINNNNLPTYFTGEILNTLYNGVDNSTSYLTIREVYKEVYNALHKMNLPLPKQSTKNNADDIAIALNNFNNKINLNNYKSIISQMNNSNANVKNINILKPKKSFVVFLVGAFLISSIVVASLYQNFETKNTYAKNSKNSTYSIENTKKTTSVISLVEKNVPEIDISNEINMARIISKADRGVKLALEILYNVQKYYPNNIEVNFLIDSLTNLD